MDNKFTDADSIMLKYRQNITKKKKNQQVDYTKKSEVGEFCKYMKFWLQWRLLSYGAKSLSNR